VRRKGKTVGSAIRGGKLVQGKKSKPGSVMWGSMEIWCHTKQEMAGDRDKLAQRLGRHGMGSGVPWHLRQDLQRPNSSPLSHEKMKTQ
jgi:hypothetical protein